MLHEPQCAALLEFRCDVFGVLLVAFKDLQATRLLGRKAKHFMLAGPFRR
jgi:hypothetical protein